jgi:SMI1-KNR4 cell-wall
MTYLEKAKALYTQLRPDEANKVEPCLESEVNFLENELSIKLPKAYREFLLWMGRYGGGFWRGSDGFYRSLTEINLWAHDLLKENSLRLPDDAFVFYWEPTQCFDFFLISEGDDPPVYFYIDPALEELIRKSFQPEQVSSAQSYLLYIFENRERDGFNMRSPSFSQCLITQITEYNRIMNKILEGRE